MRASTLVLFSAANALLVPTAHHEHSPLGAIHHSHALPFNFTISPKRIVTTQRHQDVRAAPSNDSAAARPTPSAVSEVPVPTEAAEGDDFATHAASRPPLPKRPPPVWLGEGRPQIEFAYESPLLEGVTQGETERLGRIMGTNNALSPQLDSTDACLISVAQFVVRDTPMKVFGRWVGIHVLGGDSITTMQILCPRPFSAQQCIQTHLEPWLNRHNLELVSMVGRFTMKNLQSLSFKTNGQDRAVLTLDIYDESGSLPTIASSVDELMLDSTAELKFGSLHPGIELSRALSDARHHYSTLTLSVSSYSDTASDAVGELIKEDIRDLVANKWSLVIPATGEKEWKAHIERIMKSKPSALKVSKYERSAAAIVSSTSAEVSSKGEWVRSGRDLHWNCDAKRCDPAKIKAVMANMKKCLGADNFRIMFAGAAELHAVFLQVIGFVESNEEMAWSSDNPQMQDRCGLKGFLGYKSSVPKPKQPKGPGQGPANNSFASHNLGCCDCRTCLPQRVVRQSNVAGYVRRSSYSGPSTLEYFPLEWAKDRNLQSDGFTTTQESLFDARSRALSVLVMQIPMPLEPADGNTEAFKVHLSWLLRRKDVMSADELIWVTNLAPLGGRQSDQSAAIVAWNQAAVDVVHDQRPGAVVIDAYGMSVADLAQNNLFMDNNHMTPPFNKAVADMIVVEACNEATAAETK